MELHLIGIGAGNPDLLTLQAVSALNEADLILLPMKGEDKAELAELRRAVLGAHLHNPKTKTAAFDMPTRAEGAGGEGAYLDAVNHWHDAIAASWARVIAAHPGARKVALLVWGDPALYDSSLRIAERLCPAPERVIAVPGITSLQVLTAEHRVPLNGLGGAVTLTTGRRLRTQGWPQGTTRMAVMLDGEGSFQHLVAPHEFHIWWGAYLGMAQQELLCGPLEKMGPQILALRKALRKRHGWIMDIYLLEKQTTGHQHARPAHQ